MSASEEESKASTAVAAAATEFRLRGNHEFAQGQYDHAAALYTAALEQLSSDDQIEDEDDDHEDESSNININNKMNNNSHTEELILNLCNRSACFAQQEEWERSREDAARAWQSSGHRSVKAAYRLSKTCLALKDYDTAHRTLQAALRVLQEQELTPLLLLQQPQSDKMTNNQQQRPASLTASIRYIYDAIWQWLFPKFLASPTHALLSTLLSYTKV